MFLYNSFAFLLGQILNPKWKGDYIATISLWNNLAISSNITYFGTKSTYTLIRIYTHI